MGGQYLDMLEQVLASTSVQRARHVIRYKSAKYSVQQPLLLGGALAGAPDELLGDVRRLRPPLGEAFQLRDDVLGVFGDPGRDRQAGRRRPARGQAHRAGRGGAGALLPRPGRGGTSQPRRPALDPAGVDGLREVMTESGALDVVESMIDDLSAKALRSLEGADVAEPAREVLEQLVAAATARSQ